MEKNTLMKDIVKEHILKHEELIDDNNFDFLANYGLGLKIELAEVFLEAGIDITNPDPKSLHKIANINKFLNDLRIERNEVTVSKGPLTIGDYQIAENQYALKFKFKTTDTNVDISRLREIYSVDNIIIGKRYSPRFHSSIPHDVVIINK